MTEPELAHEWTRIIAPTTGDVRTELVSEAAEFFGISIDEGWRRLRGAGNRFREEWLKTVTNRHDPESLIQFYNQSNTELFELIEWHANDPIHYRTLIVRDMAIGRPGRGYLDYGSGIGNDAMVLADAGFNVTVADVSDVLLTFAVWRLRRRGYNVRAIDLKRESLPRDGFDVVACFDVLEHIPRPVNVVRNIRAALRTNGLLVMHAPFAEDPEHPMHVVHRDVVKPRMRSLGFQPLDCRFPPFVRAPCIFEKRRVRMIDRAGYFVYDTYLDNAFGARLAALYRRARRPAVPAPRASGTADRS
jgi:SAM-dependent methyltransferase